MKSAHPLHAAWLQAPSQRPRGSLPTSRRRPAPARSAGPIEPRITAYSPGRPAGADFDGVRAPELFPGPTTRTRAELTAYIRRRVELIYHPAETCRIGRALESVVGPDLGLHGLGGLGMADASVMLTGRSGNTNASTIMIATRAAQLIQAG